MSSRPLIVVFGATGAQGGGLARALLRAPQRPFRVRAVTRRPGSAAAQALAEQGAEICAADFDDLASVERAMQAAHGAFCVTPFGDPCRPERELQHAVHLAEAARRARVRHVIWSTLEDTRRFVEADGGYHLPRFDVKGEADQFFIQRGLPLTRLLSAFCWDDLARARLWPQRDDQGGLVFPLPLGAGPVRLPGVAAEDIGACAAALFGRGAPAIGRRIGIAGEHLDGAGMAAVFARVLGEPVRHAAVDPADYARSALPGAAHLAQVFRFVRDFNDEFCAARDVAATRALHPALMRFGDFVAKHAAPDPTTARERA